MEWVSWPAVVALVGALLVTGAAMWSSIDQNRKDAELRGKAEEIAGLNRRIASLVSGHAHLSISFLIEGHQQQNNGPISWFATISIVNEGDDPAYDVVVNSVDVLKTDEWKRQHPEAVAARLVMENMFQKSLGTVTAKQVVFLGKNLLPLPDQQTEAVYEFRITTRSGVVSQVVRFIKVQGEWTFATKAIRSDTRAIVFQEITPKYPDQNIDRENWWRPQ